ncbi:hypothetical protein GTP45_08075 [Pseudoduganella sp. FT55W]|uniref:Uncharacterized protein n=1 Tax=Duganella rivi TaxID=2666083 RepID=A0A7X4GNQ4_9BURK|nr:hypothetical protein [Duganella rivi]MYM66783.1 hypothetical protein [Duganella rivi]
MLRAAVSLQLLIESGCGGVTPWWLAMLELALVLALAVGVVTPVAALFSGGFQVACLVHADWPHAATLMIATVTAIALVLTGAGAYSVDARLFGRRRLVVPPDPMDSD